MYLPNIVRLPPTRVLSTVEERNQHTGIRKQLKEPIGMAIQAIKIDDYQALHKAYAQIGIVLGVHQECINIANKHSESQLQLVTRIRKSRGGLKSTMIDHGLIDLNRIQNWARRCRVPPKICVKDAVCQTEKEVKSGKEIDVWVVYCQTEKVIESIEKKDVFEVYCQTDNQSVLIEKCDAICQTVMEVASIKKSKVRDAACQIAEETSKIKRRHLQDAACQVTVATSQVKNENTVVFDIKGKVEKKEIFDNEAMQANYPIFDINPLKIKSENTNSSTPCEIVKWKRPIPIIIDDDRKPGGGALRNHKSDPRRTTPYHRQRPRPSSNYQCTQLLITDISSVISETDIFNQFCEFRSMDSCCIHYDRSGNKIGSASVTFTERAAAIEALNYFNGSKHDGFTLNIRLATTELSM